MKVSEVLCRSALVRSRIYGVDYAVNPYTGCEHNCVYCYAVFMKKYTNHAEPWGDFVDVKINAPSILKKQLKTVKKGRVLFSSVTDAYQPLEKKYEITRNCLNQFEGTAFFVSILTKSALVSRDIDILQNMSCEVGFTFTTLDDEVKERFEPKSSSVQERLEALKEVDEAGISVYVFLGPLIPFLSDSEESISEIFTALENRVKYVIVDRMNFYNTAWTRIHSILRTWKPELIQKYYMLKTDAEYNHILRKRVMKAATVPVEFCF